MIYGQCKNCKLPIEGNAGFCDNDDLCWALWADKVLGKEMKKLEIKEHDPVKEFEAEAASFIVESGIESWGGSEDWQWLVPRIAKQFHAIYGRGITDGIEMGKMDAALAEESK